ncbi:MAG: ATP-binding cassette domain-containing protein [Ardenticatenaceae bacterium]|nr:ATP-binding cassette domain-containing protein [Ardenticatenaceae bacterium]
MAEKLLEIQKLRKFFPITQGIVFQRQVGAVQAVSDVSFDIYKGETLGLVGESGSGKTTVGRTILQLHKPTAGKVLFDGMSLTELEADAMRQVRQRMQIIFQDPYASLNPRVPVGFTVGEPIEVHMGIKGKDRSRKVQELFDLVGINAKMANRYPHEFSGGQRQRIGIARALALNPDFVVCDEPIASLDVSIQAQVVNLLKRLQKQLGLTYLFIAHDLSMVRHISDRVAVMYLGKIVELAERTELFVNPLHPYTQALISAVPIPDPDLEKQRQRIILQGDLPSPANPPQGCNFNTRCPVAIAVCYEEDPVYREVKAGHFVACHLVKNGQGGKPSE